LASGKAGDGVPTPFLLGGPVTLTFRGNLMTFRAGRGPGATFLIDVDPGKTPKTFDQRSIDDEGVTVVFLGIYKVEGDVLTISESFGEVRPTGFDPPATSLWRTLVYVRQK
jgi:uncharacterized protein (TIGR03067 family)